MVDGASVTVVNEGSAAETAGLQEGDIITALDGKAVSGSSELTSMIKQYHAGDTAELTVWRHGEEVMLSITFDEKLPEEESDDAPEESGSASMEPGQDGQYYYYGDGSDMEEFFRQFFGNFGGFGGNGR